MKAIFRFDERALHPYSFLHENLRVLRLCYCCGFGELFGEYVDLLLREAERRFGENPHFIRHLETAYFGGGTPSVLPPREFERLVLGLESLGVGFRHLQEVDWECNPDSATDENLQAAISLG